MQTLTRAHHDVIVERDADFDARPGGKDHQPAAFPIIDSGTLVMLMNRIHLMRSRGLITRKEWMEEQREAVNRTVAGDTRDMYQRQIDALRPSADDPYQPAPKGTLVGALVGL